VFAVLPLLAEFLCGAFGVLADSLSHILKLRNAFSEAAAADDLLFGWQGFNGYAGCAVEFTYGSLHLSERGVLDVKSSHS